MVTRSRAVELARGWTGTPYVLRGRVKGAGVDCATLLLEYLIEIGAAPQEAFLPLYASDWFCHESQQVYMRNLLKYACKIAEGVCRGAAAASQGDLVLFRSMHGVERFNHGAIVLDWPRILHAEYSGVNETDATRHCLTAFRPFAIFDPWGARP